MMNVNNIINSLPPQKQQEIMMLYNQATQSGNPEQFLSQRFGNNPNFQKAFNVYKTQGVEQFNNYLGNVFNSMNR